MKREPPKPEIMTALLITGPAFLPCLPYPLFTNQCMFYKSNPLESSKRSLEE